MGHGWLMLAIHPIFYPFYDQRVDPLYEPSNTSPSFTRRAEIVSLRSIAAASTTGKLGRNWWSRKRGDLSDCWDQYTPHDGGNELTETYRNHQLTLWLLNSWTLENSHNFYWKL